MTNQRSGKRIGFWPTGRELFFLLMLYPCLLLLLFIFQRDLLYHPDTSPPLAPQAYGLAGFETIHLTASDGTKLQAWYHPPASGFPLLIHFHGNAGHLGYRTKRYPAFAAEGLGVLALSYRGYGASEGSPTEAGLYDDAEAAIDYAENQGITPNQMIFYGESLGTGVAVEMALRHAPAALVLEAPYTSVVNRAQELYPWVPVSWLLQDRFDSISKIGQIHSPLLVFHGELDQVIPIHHGKTLFAAANEPKLAIYDPKTNHTDADSQVLAAGVMDFLRINQIVPKP